MRKITAGQPIQGWTEGMAWKQTACPYCGNDIHSLYVNPEGLDKSSHIVLKAVPQYEKEEILASGDTYQWLCRYLSDAGIRYPAFPYLYGTYVSGKCKKAYRVMAGVEKYIQDAYISYQCQKGGN